MSRISLGAKRKIEWTPLAGKSLNSVIAFVEDQWGDVICDQLIDALDDRIEELLVFPKIGPYNEVTSCRQLFINPFITLFYSVEEDGVRILLIWDNWQDPEAMDSL